MNEHSLSSPRSVRRSFARVSHRTFLLSLLWPVLAWSQLKDENLLENAPPGYKIGFQVKRGNMDMMEMLPESEAIEHWTELLTTQVFHGLTSATLEKFQQFFEQSSRSNCSGGTFKPIAKNSENGYPVMVGLRFCPNDPKTGKPEFTWIKAIKGNDSFYVVQKAFRFEPNKEQITQWMRYLRSVMVCDTRLQEHACPPGTPTATNG
jgi:hypothetical protein